MDPAKKRKLRLVVALGTAVLLAVALVYTSFSASSEAKEPSELLSSANPGQTYDLTGRVVPKTVTHKGNRLLFRVSDRNGGASMPVVYSGTVPDPFRGGREIVLTGKVDRGEFVGDRDTLVTKCPSKFTEGSNS
jgi:cytochrome c-type biogenesis protein CcmE